MAVDGSLKITHREASNPRYPRQNPSQAIKPEQKKNEKQQESSKKTSCPQVWKKTRTLVICGHLNWGVEVAGK